MLDHEADEMLDQILEVAVRGACRNEVPSQPGVHRGGTGRVQEWLLFKERGQQLEELPLTLVEILSRDHGATPLGSRQPSASSSRRSSVAHCSTRDDV